MASRTKSFFDSDPKNNNRRLGHGNGHGNGQWKRKDTTTNVAPPPPAPNHPIPATAEAKLKLKAFQFVAGDTATTNTSTSTSTTSPPTTHAPAFPCTPGARLPLADLLGDCDATTIKEVPVERSPEENIGWIPNSSNDLLTPNRRRKRKRAKSSSPPSAAHSSSQPRHGLADRANMKTPAADPTADLWQRYNGKPSGDGSRKLPEISSLAFHASPRPLETPVKAGGLRRWVSTGNDWPSSKHKKRCSNARASVNVWQDQNQTPVDPASRSKVASMVQRIQESLATQRIEREHELELELDHDHVHKGDEMEQDGAAITVEANAPLPTSSPAAAVVHKTRMPPPVSVSPAPARRSSVQEQPRSSPESMPQPALLRRTESGGMSAGSMGDPLHPSAAARLHLQSKAPLPAYKRPSITKPPPKLPPVVAPPPVNINNDLDEFGDAFDLDEDDLTELLSQKPLQQRSLYDIPEHPNPPAAPPAGMEVQGAIRQQPIHLDDDDDDGDEFGDDDLDVDSFAQAEFSATQAFRASPRKRKHGSPHKSGKTASTPHMSGSTASSPHKSGSTRMSSLQRFVVEKVVESEYTNPKNGRRCEEKVLLTENVNTKLITAITLRGSWTGTTVMPANVIHITHLKRQIQAPPTATPRGQILVDDSDTSPLLIIHPDHMLSATTVADSFDCTRKAVLQDRVKATSESSKAMVYGSILHELFQLALSANRWDAGFLQALVERTIESHLEGLWELGMTDTSLAREEIMAKMGELSGWAGTFVAERPGAKAWVDARQGEQVQMSVSKLIAIEEHVWSPRFGLKGNIDATVQTTLAASSKEETKLITPFEVKTGRTTQSPAHMAQTALYTLLLSDRYDVPVESGILYYLESSAMMRVKPPIVEIRAMVQQRNRVAGHIFAARNPAQDMDDPTDQGPLQSQAIEESGLPQLLRNPFKCGRCYARQSCFTFHALVENGTADSAGMIDDNKKHHSLIWGEAVGHLGLLKNSGGKGDILRRWFTKWDRLLTFEEGDQARFRKELWTMSSTEREAAGRCFGQLVLHKDLTITNATATAASAAATGTVDGVSGSGGKINRFTYVFARAVRGSGGSFAEGSALTAGEAVVVSGEQGQWALANGYVTAVSRHDITVAVDRKLGRARQRLPGFDESTNQALKGTMTVGGEDVPDETHQETMLYRLDKDEFSNGLALIRNNLVTLMSDDPMHTKLREQILFGAMPSFGTSSQVKQSTIDATQQQTQLGEMNQDQQSAVAKVLAAQNYALILGMPGTGKTTTIAHIIRALLAEGKSILLTSFTHTAVDNILLKIRDIAPKNGILRLGVPSKINKQVQNFCLLASTPRNTFEAIEQAYMDTSIVATTCMGTNHAVFQRRTFDVCIVDEASQITLPTILGPLLRARKFVLVGDHYQLPPLVQNKAALEGGLDISLFRQLSEEQPGSVVALGRQYRMCKEIMSLSNELIYSGKLQCGNESVAERELEISNPNGLDIYYHTANTLCKGNQSTCWLAHATCPKNKVVFANTDPLGKKAMESLLPGGGGGGQGGKTLTNPVEATLSAHLVLSFLAQGVPAGSIGVITLYRSQLALIRRIFKLAGVDPSVEIDSADRFQGRDKEVCVLSLVRSNEKGVVGTLLEDWRRVNVGITRARSKMVILGSLGTFARNFGGEGSVLGRFVGVVRREGWVLDVPVGAVDEGFHGFDFEGLGGLGKEGLMSGEEKVEMEMEKRGLLGSPEKDRIPLQSSIGAGNRSFGKVSGEGGGNSGKKGKMKSPTRIVKRSAGQVVTASGGGGGGGGVGGVGGGGGGSKKMRLMKKVLAREILEDLTGE